MSVSQEPQEIPGVVSAGDDENIPDPGVDKGPDGIVDHGFLENREQVLVGHPRQRVEARPETACEYDAFHPLFLPPDAVCDACAGKTASLITGSTMTSTKNSVRSPALHESICTDSERFSI